MDAYLASLAFSANTVAPIFLLVFLGIYLKHKGIINSNFVDVSSDLVFRVTLPILVFMAISGTHFDEVFEPKQLTFFLASTLASVTLLFILASRWIRDGRDLGAFVQGAFRGNYGIVGLAISANLLGTSGLAKASVLLAMVIPLYNVLSIITLTLPLKETDAVTIKRILKTIATNPLIIAVALAIPVSLLGIELPTIAHKTGEYLATMTLPLALIGIGGSLSLASLTSTSLLAFWATGIKLVVFPIALTFLAWVVGFEGETLAVFFVLFGCPTAAASFVMAKGMGSNDQLTANIILTTTLGSVISLSLGIYVLRLCGII
ncbi:MAG: AEC family transporter [Pontibacterium sp.]